MASASGSNNAVDLPIRSASVERTVYVDPVALEDAALTIERQVVGVFVDQHMRQQTRAGTATFDRA